jgi:carbon-monoxide dehydrogenase small subunit
MMLPALTTLHALLTEQPDVDADQIRDAISGTICSCTGYVPIVEAALEARAVCLRTEGGRP